MTGELSVVRALTATAAAQRGTAKNPDGSVGAICPISPIGPMRLMGRMILKGPMATVTWVRLLAWKADRSYLKTVMQKRSRRPSEVKCPSFAPIVRVTHTIVGCRVTEIFRRRGCRCARRFRWSRRSGFTISRRLHCRRGHRYRLTLLLPRPHVNDSNSSHRAYAGWRWFSCSRSWACPAAIWLPDCL